ncbi:MAG: YebC/PmpR family DNA-binding transcriptional regulator [Candidatus Comchoanobacterales bacterium]
MAGHSKWANIRHRKGKQDAKRGKIFTKIIREITTAARMGGADLEHNPGLRLAISKAQQANMPKDNIARAIARGAGGDDGEQLESVIYEGYGPGGVAMMVSCLTDNRNRTVAEVRHAFSKCGGSLGTDGSVAYLFERKGHIWLANCSDEQVMESVLSDDVSDIEQYDQDCLLTTQATTQALEACLTLCQDASLEVISSELTQVASTSVNADSDLAEKITRLVDMLEDCDDVQEVYHNAVLPNEDNI